MRAPDQGISTTATKEEPMPDIPRQFHQPVAYLPRSRNSTHDRHHLFWPGTDMRRLGFTEFRAIGCTSASRLDSLVHSVIHQRYAGVLALDPDGLQDLAVRTSRCLDRHYERRCACWTTTRACVVDTLTLEACEPRRFEGPPCTAIVVDGQIYELMRDYYAAVAPITLAVRHQLASRCDANECGCMITRGALRLRQPAIWGQLQQRAV